MSLWQLLPRKRTGQNVMRTASKEVPGCGYILHIGTFLLKSFGCLPVISTIPGNEKCHDMSTARCDVKRIRKTHLVVSPQQEGSCGRRAGQVYSREEDRDNPVRRDALRRGGFPRRRREGDKECGVTLRMVWCPCSRGLSAFGDSTREAQTSKSSNTTPWRDVEDV